MTYKENHQAGAVVITGPILRPSIFLFSLSDQPSQHPRFESLRAIRKDPFHVPFRSMPAFASCNACYHRDSPTKPWTGTSLSNTNPRLVKSTLADNGHYVYIALKKQKDVLAKVISQKTFYSSGVIARVLRCGHCCTRGHMMLINNNHSICIRSG